MSKKLLILESPTKAKKVQEYLGPEYIVQSSNGHLDDLPINPKNGIGIDLKNDFKMTYQILPDKINTVKNILEQAEKCSEVILSSDQDREGEKISASIKKFTDYLHKKTKRVVFTEITKSGIKKGLEAPREIDDNLVRSQEVRRCIDRICGYQISPFVNLVFSQKLSAGRVQSICAKIISDREQEIEKFSPEKYFNLYAKFLKENKDSFIAKFEPKISTQEQASKLLSEIKQEDNFIVQSVKSQIKKEYPNPPFTTSACLQSLAKKYHIPGDEGQKVLQFLFESGFITYPRSDSTRVSDDFLLATHKFLKSKNYDIPKKPIQYEPKDSAQNAHESLRPTSLDDIPNLSGNSKLVYEEIFNQYIASQLNPAIFDTLQVKITGTKNKNLIFKVSGKSLRDPGYLVVWGKIDSSKIEIPTFIKNEILTIEPSKIKVEEKQTQPPPRYNDHTFLKYLEDNRVGRPSTVGAMISVITSRGYVIKNKNTYYPTELGKQITKLLSKYFSIMDVNFTANLEDKLDQIAEGKIDYLQVLRDFYSEFKSQLDRAYTDNGFEICKCGGIMLKRKTPKGEFLGCNKFCGNLIVLSRNEGQTKEAV